LTRQLNVRSDEAYELASRIASQTGRSRTDVVLAALLAYAEKRIGKKLTARQRTFVDELMALARKSAEAADPRMTSDHGYLYDEKGLPR
jgi:antitoxin VapB